MAYFQRRRGQQVTVYYWDPKGLTAEEVDRRLSAIAPCDKIKDLPELILEALFSEFTTAKSRDVQEGALFTIQYGAVEWKIFTEKDVITTIEIKGKEDLPIALECNPS